jgi:hypothetical protein
LLKFKVLILIYEVWCEISKADLGVAAGGYTSRLSWPCLDAKKRFLCCDYFGIPSDFHRVLCLNLEVGDPFAHLPLF